MIVNVLSDAKKYVDSNSVECSDVLCSIARASLSFSHILSFTELKFLTDLFVCSEESTVEWKINVFVALSDALTSTEKGRSISPLIDLLSRYTKSKAITQVLSSSIHFINEEIHSRLLEYVSLLARIPDIVISLSLGSRSAHECTLKIGETIAQGMKEGLSKAWTRLREATEGHNDLRVLSSMLTKGRHLRVSQNDTLMSTVISYLRSRKESPLWDEIAQTLVVSGECSVLEQEQIVNAVIEECDRVDDYKRFFGHWLTRNKTVERVCMVKYVVQRPLEKKQTRTLIEYIDWSGGMERLKEISLRLIRVMSTRMGVAAHEREAIHRVRVLIECGRRMRMRDEGETASFWREHYPLVMQSTRLSIESNDGQCRECGLIVSECVSLWMDKDNCLQFDYSEERKELIEELKKRARGEEEENESEVEVVEEEERKEESKEEDKVDREEKGRRIVDEMDSDDTDDEMYEQLHRNRVRKDKEMISPSYEGAKVHAPPSYLREALEWIATEKEKYDKFEAALISIEALFRKKAVGWNEVGLSALTTLIHLEDRFATQGFDNTVIRSMVAIVVGQPSQLAPFLAETIFERNVVVKQRYLITTVLVNAAKELAGMGQSGEKTMINPYKEYDVTQPHTSKHEDTQPDWVRVVSERVRANTRRFTIRPASQTSSEHKYTTENRFARVADRFILPLLKTRVGDHLELTGRDIHLLVRVLYTACELLTLAEHSPSVTRIALSLAGSVETLRYHEDGSVREVVVAAYLAAATVLPEETLALECKPWLQFCVNRINDGEEGEKTRKLADQTAKVILIRLRLDEGAELD